MATNLTCSKARPRCARVACGFAGLGFTLVKGTDATYAHGLGMTSLEDGGIPVTDRTLSCVGSISTSLTGTRVIRLVEEEHLNLDRLGLDSLPRSRSVIRNPVS